MTPADITYIALDAEWRLAPHTAEALEMAGHHITVVAHGPEALIALATRKVEVVVVEVLDLNRHGAAFARIIRERPAFENLPMIALTQEIPLASQAGLLMAGYDQVLHAPDCGKYLVNALAPWLASQQRPIKGLLQACGEAFKKSYSLAQALRLS